MKKEIVLYEAFAGIGAQWKALKNLSEKLNIKVTNIGSCEWYIDAIISYISIHYGILNSEINFSKQEMVDKLKNMPFSSDSKKPVKDNYFLNMKENKLRSIFPYLYGYINNDYLLSKLNKTRERERENFVNISNLINLPRDIDIFTYSFPCQDISQQGKQKGINPNTRSGLLLQIEKILKNNQKNLPKVLLLENVKALVSKKFLNQFQSWIETLNDLGYESDWKVLNSSDYGSSQNRERVFLVSILKNKIKKKFAFPKISNKNKTLSEIIKIENSTEKLDLIKNFKISSFKTTSSNITKSKLLKYTTFNSEAYIYAPINKGPTLTASGANSRLKFYFEENKQLRYMTPSEAFLYMGFEEDDYLKVKNTNLITKNKMLFLCGNSISVEVLESLFKEIIKCI